MGNNVLSSTGRVTLWIGAVILFVAAWIFINRALRFHHYADNMDLSLRQFAFFSARYIDWVLTTPIMIHGLVHFAGAPDDTFVYLFFMDILMIVSGLIASVVCDSAKWFFFGFSILCFIPIIAYICWWKNKVVDAQFDYGFYFWNYGSMANLTTIAWFLYPVVWIMSEGLTVLSADGEAIVYTVLDLISKVLLGMFVISARSIAIGQQAELFAALNAANIAFNGGVVPMNPLP